ncbi:MAG TPA: CPBP family intramembrane glutamic endopeptidase [Gemmatimonadales bacterium]|nr:CPBP family intramembrane glutamic endopeptidase [Gemmatimonadales bacterium]
MARVLFLHRLKDSGWAVAWLLLFAVVGVAVTVGLAQVVPGIGGRDWELARQAGYQAVGFLVATTVVGRWWNRHRWARMGWRGSWSAPSAWVRGTGIGIAMAIVAVGLAALLGGASVHHTPTQGAWLAAVAPVFIGLLLAALSEELMFRGYPLRRLADAVTPPAATALLALGFGLVHVGNPNATVGSTVNVMLAGVFLSLAFFSRRGMPLAWGLHLGWNAGLALLLDAPVSGYVFHIPGVMYTPGPHPWLDGGAFGPEGGLVATVTLLAGCAAVLGERLRSPARWWSAEPAREMA